MTNLFRDFLYGDFPDPNKKIEELGDQTAQLQDSVTNIQSVVVDIGKFPKLDVEVNDTPRFKRAFDYLKTKGGGIVKLPIGVFIANIKVPTYCGIIGNGKKTIIQLPNNSTSAAVELEDVNVRSVFLDNFSIDGNKANQTSTDAKGVYIKGGAITGYTSPVDTNDPRHTIQNIFITNTKGIGFHITGRGGNTVTNVQVIFSDQQGIYIDCYDSVFTMLDSGANAKSGIYVGASGYNNRIVGSKGWNNGVYAGKDSTDGFGFYISSVEGTSLSGCEAQANFHHGYYFQNTKAVVGIGLVAEYNGDGGVNTCGFAFDGAKNCTIVGSVRNGNSTNQDYAVGLYNYADSNNIIVSSYQMTTGAVDNPQGRTTNNIQILGDKVAREAIYDYFNVGGNMNKALAKFAVEGKRGENIVSALFTKNFNGDLSEDELLRLSAWDGASTYHNLSVKHNMTSETTKVSPKTRLYIDKETQIGDGLWNGQRLKLGAYHLWVDSTGKLRMKNGAPTSDTDGTVVGTQA